MRRLLCLSTLLALAAGSQAFALGQLADVTVVDRDTGATLQPFVHGGEYWVAGRPGARYGIQIQNSTGGRLLAVMSVDGVNILTGTTAAWDQRGYVFSPQDSYLITGWRKSNEEVAAFTFTASQDSYASRTGRPDNVGVIGVALFRERPQHVRVPPISAPGRLYNHAATPGAAPGRAASAPPAGTASGAVDVDVIADPRHAESKLGTGHGEIETSVTTITTFNRMQKEPNEVVVIHYDSLTRLIAMGIVPASAAGGKPEPFPASRPEYVPDPPPQQ